jgi:hypothetical protein
VQIDLNIAIQEGKKELARREFFYFCHMLAPDFYKMERQYLKTLCAEMQNFYESNDDVAIFNLPP